MCMGPYQLCKCVCSVSIKNKNALAVCMRCLTTKSTSLIPACRCAWLEGSIISAVTKEAGPYCIPHDPQGRRDAIS